ncbi:ABC transporter permease [Actinophytocola glycyrrhizae]|uniref:ABC transporter permease n=1 Tax=Actinophytocola glycyrrhizae TaxID=2044873 RepID=A0ABV9S6I2_9PSEU
MTTRERAQTSLSLWRVAEAARFGWREYAANLPPAATIFATIPKGVLQIVFFTVLGGVVAGEHHTQYAFVGGLVIALTTTNTVNVINVPFGDKYHATFWRIRTGDMPVAAVLYARAAPYLAVGFGLFLIEATIAAALLGLTNLGLHVLPWLPIFALMACGYALLGIAAATLTIAKRADVLAPNLLGYLTILCSGAFLPPDKVGWIDTIGSVLPVRHGLAAVHAGMAGRPWLAEALLELTICLVSAVLGLFAVAVQTRRATRHGHDDFA